MLNNTYVYIVVIFYDPPENKTVCRGSNVIVRCGYLSSIDSYVIWIINGMSLNESAIRNIPFYQLDNIKPPFTIGYSLTVLSINVTTTFQCIVHPVTNRTIMKSVCGTVTVFGMYVRSYICCSLLS